MEVDGGKRGSWPINKVSTDTCSDPNTHTYREAWECPALVIIVTMTKTHLHILARLRKKAKFSFLSVWCLKITFRNVNNSLYVKNQVSKTFNVHSQLCLLGLIRLEYLPKEEWSLLHVFKEQKKVFKWSLIMFIMLKKQYRCNRSGLIVTWGKYRLQRHIKRRQRT